MKALESCLKILVLCLIYGCCIYLLSCSEGTVPTASDKANIVISGFLYTNEQVSDIRVVNTTPAGVKDTTVIVFDSLLDDFDTMRIMPTEPINDAEVFIYANGTAYPLVNTNDSGYYSDPDSTIIVTPGVTYRIEVKVHGKIAVSETIVPEEAPSLTLSRDTLFRSQQSGRPRPDNSTGTTTTTPMDSALYISKLRWYNPDGSPYYIVLQLAESEQNNESANNEPNNRPPNMGSGLNRGRGYFTRSDTVSITTLRGRKGGSRDNVSSLIVNRTGIYEVKIYRVNTDYRELDQFIQQQNAAERQGTGLFLEEPPSNVTGGLGIFAAFTSSIKAIHVVNPDD